MFNEEEYSSDTSDEDFIPRGVESDDDEPESENEDHDENEDNEEETPKGKKRKQNKMMRENKRKKPKRKNPLLAAVEESNPDTEIEDKEKQQMGEVEEAKNANSLWADFLADVDEKPPEQPKSKSINSWARLLDPKKKSSSSSNSILSEGSTSRAATVTSTTKKPQAPSTVKVTKVFEFAGEEVRVEEVVAADSAEAKASALIKNENSLNPENAPGVKKSLGLSSVISLLDNKKNKLSTLEKSKLDWVNFKSSEGIEEEMQTHLKSKEGFLEKQAFLERADLRQFEIERNMRMSKRNNR